MIKKVIGLCLDVIIMHLMLVVHIEAMYLGILIRRNL